MDFPTLDSSELASRGILTLAYVGDGVYELMARTRLVQSSSLSNDDMHKRALKYVNANAQAIALAAVRETFSDEELKIFLRGRNAHTGVPKSSSPAAYHAATGLEALFGWLYLSGRRERLVELFDACAVAIDSSKN